MESKPLAELEPAQRKLIDAAEAAMANAYSPYSGLRVGAALWCADGVVVPGANLENVSYSLTLCAERAALAAANSQGHRSYSAIAVIASGADFAPADIISPCCACRQVLAE